MSKTILMIDDENKATEHYRLALKLKGYTVVFFSDPVNALEYAEKGGNANLILLDLSMPPYGNLDASTTRNGLGSGIALYADLRKHRQLKSTPIIILTNVVQEEILAQLPENDPGFAGIAFKLENDPLEMADRIVDLIGPA